MIAMMRNLSYFSVLDASDVVVTCIHFVIAGAVVTPFINSSSLSDDMPPMSEWCLPNISLARNFSSVNAHLSDAVGSLRLDGSLNVQNCYFVVRIINTFGDKVVKILQVSPDHLLQGNQSPG